MVEKCKHIATRGKNVNEQCTKNGLHNGYCHKHKKRQIPDHIKAEVSLPVAPPAPPAPKKKYSVFKWTINSNESLLDMPANRVKKFKQIIDHLFKAELVSELLIDRTSGDNIIDIKSEFYFEHAPTTHALHVHGIIRLEHKGNFQLDLNAIRNIVERLWGKKVHLKNEASGDSTKGWEDYIKKQQGDEKI